MDAEIELGKNFITLSNPSIMLEACAMVELTAGGQVVVRLFNSKNNPILTLRRRKSGHAASWHEKWAQGSEVL